MTGQRKTDNKRAAAEKLKGTGKRTGFVQTAVGRVYKLNIHTHLVKEIPFRENES